MVRRCNRLALLLFLACGCGGPPALPEARPLWVWDVGRVLELAPWTPEGSRARFHAADPGAAADAVRLVGPVVLLDVREGVAEAPAYRVTGRDLARWQDAFGEVPQGAIVLVLTGGTAGSGEAGPSVETGLLDQLCARFRIRGLATDLPELGADARAALEAGGAWWLTGLEFPAGLAVGRGRLVVAPFPGEGPACPARVFLLLPRGMARR